MIRIAILLLFINMGLQAQNAQFSEVKINLIGKNIEDLRYTGIDACSGKVSPHRHIHGIYSETELANIKAAGFTYEVIIDDVISYYKTHGTMVSSTDFEDRGDGCEGDSNEFIYETPEHYVYGSMGGYLTYSEAIVELKRMAELYPSLISAPTAIGDFLSHDGHSIDVLKISDNPNMNESEEPQILFTALHHAREPNSLSQLIFYMWYLLENYETNEEVQYLVDNTEIYFVPIINPDGYILNELQEPNGGGLWRKNTWRNENGDLKGVDLNRNYDYFWAFDDNGSSPDENSDVFRGPSGFSEPELQAIQSLSIEKKFEIVLNYHTYGNLLIHPWGYNDQPTEEDSIFKTMASLMADENDYFIGTGTETVGYVVNGNSDDYHYGEVSEKPKSYAMTPEVGPSFWPSQSDIDGLNKSTMRMNLNACHLLHKYGKAEELLASNQIIDQTGSFQFKVKRFGLKEGGLDFEVKSLSPGLSLSNNIQSDIILNQGEFEIVVVNYSLDNTVLDGEEIRLELIVDNGLFQDKTTLIKTYNSNQLFDVMALDNNNDLSLYALSGAWDITTEDFVSEPHCITDSPNGDYENNMESEIMLGAPIDLTQAQSAFLKFFAKWDIEDQWDFVQIKASIDGVNFTALCGGFTNTAAVTQLADAEPVYDGVQSEWVEEKVCLDDYIGEMVYIKFTFFSDGYVQGDGFYFDNISIETYSETTSLIEKEDIQVQYGPNPFSTVISISIEDENVANYRFEIKDLHGRNIKVGALLSRQTALSTEEWAAGTYVLILYNNDTQVYSKKLIKV